MTAASELWALFAEVGGAGWCSHPVRLSGRRLDRETGELEVGSVTIACKDRRWAVCPACSALYKADAWQLVAAGLRGGKGVPSEVGAHPLLFVTLTAPSFGPVHARVRGNDTALCHPRRRPEVCPHGVTLACGQRHRVDDPVLGEPLCPRCFDYQGAVLWNAHVSRLWGRTTVATVRALAKEHGCSEKALRQVARLSFVKVAEFQLRGLVHVHAVIRGDGREGPEEPAPSWLDTETMARALTAAVESTTVIRIDGQRGVGWGKQLDIRRLDGTASGLDRNAPGVDGAGSVAVAGSAGRVEAIAAYVAKYATKTSDGAGQLARPLRSISDLDRLDLRPHLAELVRTAWRLGTVSIYSDLRLRAHAHTFGYPGHFTTKSRRYSTTFGALRQARADYHGDAEREALEVDGRWHYVGRGYDHPNGERLAGVLFEATRRAPGPFPGTSQSGSPAVPHSSDQA
ncbi:MAG TPA: replication initiator [Acidimicrobiales bacterium]|nr:replication initiator [Acidimicrobiales bacterium]